MSREVLKFDDWTAEVIETIALPNLRAAEARELHWIQRTPNCVNKNLLSGANKSVLSLDEPLNLDKLNEIIASIQSRQHVLLPVGQSKEHDKVRDVLKYLMAMRKRPVVTEYAYLSGIGRLYVKGGTKTERSKSLQGCFKGLRAPLIGHVGHDIDIENSLPTLAVQWLEKLTALGKADL
eukprot:3615447-Prymnesium_polylepis.1